jgi:hypothetical protein
MIPGIVPLKCLLLFQKAFFSAVGIPWSSLISGSYQRLSWVLVFGVGFGLSFLAMT